MDSAEILRVITLAVSSWTLLEVIKQGKAIVRINQKLRDLPCGDCEIEHTEP